VLAEFGAFENKATREDTFDVSNFPAYLRRLVEALALTARPRRTFCDAFAFCLHVGLGLLERWPEVEIIRQCREAIIVAGADAVVWFETFKYQSAARYGGRARLWTRHIAPSDKDRCQALAIDLGLPRSEVAILAIMATIFHLPSIRGDVRKMIFDELAAFRRAVRDRAVEAGDLLQRVANAPTPPPFEGTWDDVENS
jgi:hypothetical protein